MGRRIIGFDLQRLLILSDCVVEFFLRLQSQTKVVMEFGVVRLDLHRLLKLSNRLVKASAARQSYAKVGVGLGVARA